MMILFCCLYRRSFIVAFVDGHILVVPRECEDPKSLPRIAICNGIAKIFRVDNSRIIVLTTDDRARVVSLPITDLKSVDFRYQIRHIYIFLVFKFQFIHTQGYCIEIFWTQQFENI